MKPSTYSTIRVFVFYVLIVLVGRMFGFSGDEQYGFGVAFGMGMMVLRALLVDELFQPLVDGK